MRQAACEGHVRMSVFGGSGRPSLTRVRERGAQLARAADGSTSATANEMRIVSVAQVVVSMLKSRYRFEI